MNPIVGPFLLSGKKLFRLKKEPISDAQALPTPIGKDIGEAIQNGLDTRGWLLNKIK